MITFFSWCLCLMLLLLFLFCLTGMNVPRQLDYSSACQSLLTTPSQQYSYFVSHLITYRGWYHQYTDWDIKLPILLTLYAPAIPLSLYLHSVMLNTTNKGANSDFIQFITYIHYWNVVQCSKIIIAFNFWTSIFICEADMNMNTVLHIINIY
jgi:hypothetical protein